MSKEKPSSPESAETPSAKRRSAKSRSGKPIKSAKTADKVTEDPGAERSSPPYPVFDLAESAPSNESPKPSGSGDASPQENAKRKRRRKKGKGGGSQNAAQSAGTDASAEPAEESSAGEVAATPRAAHQPRLKLDSEGVSKLAWKIYLAEVSEEGVALIGDSDAKELSRRCFRLAEIFMEEQSRRR